MALKQTTYEFTVRVKHPQPEKAEYQIAVMRELAYRLSTMLHDAKFHNGVIQITPPVKKRHQPKKKTAKPKVVSSPYFFPGKDGEEKGEVVESIKSNTWTKQERI